MNDNKALRLLVTTRCNRGCLKCVNKQFNLEDIPVATHYNLRFYNTIILTGGEPMLRPNKLVDLIGEIRATNPRAKLLMYTAWSTRPYDVVCMLHGLDGLTLTLHDNYDTPMFVLFADIVNKLGIHGKSLRLNVFEEVTNFDEWKHDVDLKKWDIRTNMVWLDPCPMPKNEDFKQWKELY